jgi:dolichol-phosphate mannosyltransferase
MKTVIIPTLNEVDNINQLLRSIFKYMGRKNVHIIVVDDDSNDGTQQAVQELTKSYEGISLYVRKKQRGLSSAVRLGAKHAKSASVVVMDADFSHHPRYIPVMFEKLDDGFDVVVGSRHIRGGAIVGWPGSRIAISKFATRLAALLFRVKTKDPMSGFVGCKSANLLVGGFQFANFKFLLELLVRNPSLSVADVPIVFHDRVKGQSKLGSGTIIQFLKLVIQLFFTRGPRQEVESRRLDNV